MEPQLDQYNAITVIEFHMMDKRLYFPLTALSGFTIRSFLYPFSLIKTRMQLQRHNSSYNSLLDAFKKITRQEGYKGLYQGFWISNLMIFSQVSYVGTYEIVRHFLTEHSSYFSDSKLRSFIAGGCASIVGQTSVVPIDIVSQHLQMLGSSNNFNKNRAKNLLISNSCQKTRMGAFNAIIIALYKQNGLRSFYRGYWVSLATYAPSSGLWWFFYDIYCSKLDEISPIWVPRLVLQCIAAPLGGASTTVFTTPMDAIRARVQVERGNFISTTKELWHEEGLRICFKGLSARLTQSIFFSFFIMLGYETIKRWSLLDSYKGRISW